MSKPIKPYSTRLLTYVNTEDPPVIRCRGYFKTSNMSKIEQVKIPISGAKYILARYNDWKTMRGANIGWVEWDDDGKFKYLHQKPEIGFSLMVDPHSWAYTWLTTPVTEIVEQGETHIVFKTENSNYELTWTK